MHGMQANPKRLLQATAGAIEVCPDAGRLWDSLSILLTVLGNFDHADAAARHDPAALKSVMIRA